MGYIVKREHGIGSLRGYANGGDPSGVSYTGISGLPRLPLAFKQIVGDVIGKQVRERLGMDWLGNLIGSRPITEHSMSQSEHRALQDAVLRGMGGTLQDRGVLEYEDYATSGDDPYADVGGSEGSGIISKFFDPSFSMKATFGQAAIERDPETGDYYMTDQYNFNERLPESTEFGRNPEWSGDLLTREEGRLPGFLDILKSRSAEQGAYGVPRAFGQAYGSPEGEGSPVRVNLGDLQEALARSRGEERPGLLARGIEGLKNMFRREEDEIPQYVRDMPPGVQGIIPSAPAPVIPSAPGAIGVADISRQLSAAQERDRLMREMRAGAKQ